MTKKLEYQELLRYGVDYFRHKAGYIPPKMPINHDWLGELTVTVALRRRAQNWFVGDVQDYLYIKFETVCHDCVYKIKKSKILDDGERHYVLVSGLDDWQNCELCNMLGIDSIPY